MLKALIFDMDGVIIDSEPIHIEVNTKLLQDMGITIAESENYEFIGARSEEMWDILIKRYNIPETVESLMNKQKSYKMQRFMNEELEPIDGIKDLLRAAKRKGLKIALATSSPLHFAKFILNRIGLKVFFDKLITADHISRSKPDPEIYLTAAEQLRVLPEECIAIEDAPLGIQAAQSAGMKCIGFKNLNSGDLDISFAEYVVSSIKEIDLDIIQKTWE